MWSLNAYKAVRGYMCKYVFVSVLINRKVHSEGPWSCLPWPLPEPSHFSLKVSYVCVWLLTDRKKERQTDRERERVCVGERVRGRESECQTLNDPSREGLQCVCSSEARTGKHREISYLSQ